MIRQAGLAREIAARASQQFVAERRPHRPFDCADLAKGATHRAKGRPYRVGSAQRNARLGAIKGIERLVNQMEDAIDELEQAAFAPRLVPTQIAPVELLDPLG